MKSKYQKLLSWHKAIGCAFNCKIKSNRIPWQEAENGSYAQSYVSAIKGLIFIESPSNNCILVSIANIYNYLKTYFQRLSTRGIHG